MADSPSRQFPLVTCTSLEPDVCICVPMLGRDPQAIDVLLLSDYTSICQRNTGYGRGRDLACSL